MDLEKVIRVIGDVIIQLPNHKFYTLCILVALMIIAYNRSSPK